MDPRFPPLRSQQQIDAIAAPRAMPAIWMTFGLSLVAGLLLAVAG
jgi:ABC-type sulfate transport system permease component